MPDLSKKDIEALVSIVKREHGEIMKAERTSLAHAKKAGEQLQKLRDHIKADPKLSWPGWVEAETGLSPQMANNYIRIFEKWETVKDEPGIKAALLAARTPRAKRQTRKPVTAFTVNQITDLMHRFDLGDDVDKLVKMFEELNFNIVKDNEDHGT